KAEKEEKLRLSDSQILKAMGEKDIPDPSPEENASLEVVSHYEKFVEKAIEIRDRVVNDLGISPSPILSDLHYVIENNLIDKLYEYAMSTPDDYEQIIVHNVNVTFTSLRIGKGMNYETKRFLQLGLAAFLQNVGMYKIPEHILRKKSRLEDFEVEIVRKHPEQSSQILSKMGSRYQWLAEIVLQVHERSDGSGYPRGLRGPEISELASIIGLTDTFTAMIKPRPYRDKFQRPEAVKYIIKEAKRLFPPKILKVFLNQISLFPVNTYVRLNNKSIGRVVSTDQRQPLRPEIELLYDALGSKLQKREIIRLSENPLLYIVESLDDAKSPDKA
ncbi:MAG: HD domain-containing protein, partial [Proteobacteria bacterium]|nr:HD domain-containing protein [Pseudomonadota bacterium]